MRLRSPFALKVRTVSASPLGLAAGLTATASSIPPGLINDRTTDPDDVRSELDEREPRGKTPQRPDLGERGKQGAAPATRPVAAFCEAERRGSRPARVARPGDRDRARSHLRRTERRAPDLRSYAPLSSSSTRFSICRATRNPSTESTMTPPAAPAPKIVRVASPRRCSRPRWAEGFEPPLGDSSGTERNGDQLSVGDPSRDTSEREGDQDVPPRPPV